MSKLDKETILEMIRLRVDEKLSLSQISKRVGVGRTSAARHLKNHPLSPDEVKKRWREQVVGQPHFLNNIGRPGPDLTGMKFERLTVLYRELTGRRHTRWRCDCTCGNSTLTRTENLLDGTTKSCGCYARDMSRLREQKDPALVNFNHVVGRYKKSASIRSLEFKLNTDECAKLFSGACHYCGALSSNSIAYHKNRSGEGRQYVMRYNGIDRVNPKIGYIMSNCVSCCKICNYAKLDMSYEDFMSWIDKIINYRTSSRTSEI